MQTDATRKNELGYAMLEQDGDSYHLIHSGSRYITDIESRYAIVELKALAAAWATSKCKKNTSLDFPTSTS